MSVSIPTSHLSPLYLEDMMISCGNRTSRWPRHLIFPLPPTPPSLLSVCVCELYECVLCVWGLGDSLPSHCPIIPAPLTLCILWDFLLTRERVRDKKKGKKRDGGTRKEEEEDWRKSALRTQSWFRSTVTTDLNNCVCVCCPVFPQWIPRWEQLICRSTVQERVCHLDLDVCEYDDGGDVIVIL